MKKKSFDSKKQFEEDLEEVSTFKCGNCGNISIVNAVKEYAEIDTYEEESPWGTVLYTAGEKWELIFCPNCKELNLRHVYIDDRRDPEIHQPKILYPTKSIPFINSSSDSSNAMMNKSSDLPPNFPKLVSDIEMREILERRWFECINCINANAPLAAVVMIGGLLEAVLLARVNYETNKISIFTSISAPKDKKTGQAFQLKDWGLSNYIDVAHELNWISRSAKDVSVVLRDYRNYVHPHKEQLHKMKLENSDALIFWEVAKSIISDLLKNI